MLFSRTIESLLLHLLQLSFIISPRVKRIVQIGLEMKVSSWQGRWRETGWARGGIHRKMQIVGSLLFLGLGTEFLDVYDTIRCYNFVIYLYTPYIFFFSVSNIIMKLTYNF